MPSEPLNIIVRKIRTLQRLLQYNIITEIEVTIHLLTKPNILQ